MTRFTSSPVKGSARGRLIGFPTINLDMADVPEGLEEGIYAGWVELNSKKYPAAIHYGARPVFRDTPSFEVHVIDQVVAQVPPRVTVELVAHLRGIQNFPSSDDLAAQLHRDVDTARAMLVDDAS